MKLLYGSQNFGYDLPNSDKDWLEVVYPTWDDVVNDHMKMAEHIDSGDGSHLKIRDIRAFVRMFSKLNFQDLQVLYSQQYIDCGDLAKFISKRDKIFRSNKYECLKHNYWNVFSCLKHDTNPKTLTRCEAILRLLNQLNKDSPVVFLDKSLSDLRLTLLESTDKQLELYKEDIKNRLNVLDTKLKPFEGVVDTGTQTFVFNEVTRLLKLSLATN